MLVKGNSPRGVSEQVAYHNGMTDSNRPTDGTLKVHSASRLSVPSVSHPFGDNFGDKRRRLLSTPLLTGYYVTDRPPDGPSYNNREC